MASSIVTMFMGVAPQILKRELLTWSNMDPSIKPVCAQIGMLNRLDLKGINERKKKEKKPLKPTLNISCQGIPK